MVKKFNTMKLRSARKNPVERLCILLELVSTQLEELGMKILDKHFVLKVLGNLPKEYDVQCQMMRIGLSARKISIESMYKQLELCYDDLCGTKTSHKNSCRKSTFFESDSESSSSGTEDALLATQFKGRCRRCGTFRHKANQPLIIQLQPRLLRYLTEIVTTAERKDIGRQIV